MVEDLSSAFTSLLLAIDAERHVATLTLNRPGALNSLSRTLAKEISVACNRLDERHEVRALVVMGAGERAFSTGADLKERRSLSARERNEHTAAIEAAAEAMAALPMPTIAAIQGYALAGGAELAIACDMRVAAANSVFGFPEVCIGIFPGAGGVLRLPRIVGGGAARDLLFTGRRINAEEALRIGLIDRLTAPEELIQSAHALAEAIGANAPLAVRAVKRALRESDGQDHPTARTRVNALRSALDGTADYEEGLLAFAEKRRPRFTGR